MVTVASLAGSGAYAVLAGQDMNWDLLNYHYYSAYALLTGRLEVDIMPGNAPGYLNPLVYLPVYGLIQALPPIVAGALIGAASGLCAVILYALAHHVLPGDLRRGRPVLAAAIALTGVTGPLFLSEIGTSFVDNLSAIAIAAALLALVRDVPGSLSAPVHRSGHLLAGLLLGAAVGIKLTNAIYAVAMTLALLVLWARGETTLRRLAAYAAGGIAGFALTGGYWAVRLWQAFESPVFPFYNAIFRSPLFEAIDVVDRRFLPHSALDALSYPFQWLIGLHPSGEVPFRDARFALIALLVPVVLAMALWDRAAGPGPRAGGPAIRPPMIRPGHAALILSFFFAAYAVWLTGFAIHRYAIPLEVLTGLVLFILIDRLFATRRSRIAGFALAAVIAVAWTRPADWGRLPYGTDWFGVAVSAALAEPDTVFVLAGVHPSAYVIPFLPADSRFVRVAGYFRPDPETGPGRRIADIIARHDGPIRTLTNQPIHWNDVPQLHRFGLTLDRGDCVRFASHNDRFESCRLIRRSGSAPVHSSSAGAAAADPASPDSADLDTGEPSE